MKKLLLLCIIIGQALIAQAQNQKPPRLNKEDFRAKQEAFIAEKAGLTADEAKAFFPIYFELQDKKAKINDEAWHKSVKCEKEDMTDSQYEDVLKELANAKIESDKLDLEYIDKYKKVISPKKIFFIQRAEIQFHRHMLRIMHKPGEGPAPKGKERK